MSIFGDLERLLADLYPYRVPLMLGGFAFAAIVLALAVRRGWYRPLFAWVDANRLSTAIGGVLFLAVALPTGYYVLSPLWERTTLVEASPFDSPVSVDSRSGSVPASADSGTSSSESTPASSPTAPADEGSAQLVSLGSFEGADAFHFAEGQALIVETTPGEHLLRFEDFSIRNGPDLFVYLSSSPDAPSEDGVRLGSLKATDGEFNYEIPVGTDISALRYAIVWCDQFGVLFATAPLEA